jgi:hypothetical protein
MIVTQNTNLLNKKYCSGRPRMCITGEYDGDCGCLAGNANAGGIFAVCSVLLVFFVSSELKVSFLENASPRENHNDETAPIE